MIAPPLGRLLHFLCLGLPAPVAGADPRARGLVVVDQVQVLVALRSLLSARRGPGPQPDRLSLAEMQIKTMMN